MRFPARRLTRFMYFAAVIATATTAPSAQEQTPASPPPSSETEVKFEVTSVRKSPPPGQGMIRPFRLQGGRFSMGGMSAESLIMLAYGVQRFQLIGGPGWVKTERFDINAVTEDVPLQPTQPGTPNRMQLVVRSLLKERFALKTHHETRELPLSYLVLAREDRKLGERLRPSTIDCRGIMAERAKAAREGAPPAPPAPLKPGEIPQCLTRGGFGSITASSMTMPNLASFLAAMLNRPVYDRTNLTGNFDVQLDYTPDQMPQIPPGVTLPPGLTLPSPDGPSLNTALREQLGLKLDATRGPVDVIVIDSVEQPTPD
jgi:uncharacterized protein (TIGR03435 family)